MVTVPDNARLVTCREAKACDETFVAWGFTVNGSIFHSFFGTKEIEKSKKKRAGIRDWKIHDSSNHHHSTDVDSNRHYCTFITPGSGVVCMCREALHYRSLASVVSPSCKFLLSSRSVLEMFIREVERVFYLGSSCPCDRHSHNVFCCILLPSVVLYYWTPFWVAFIDACDLCTIQFSRGCPWCQNQRTPTTKNPRAWRKPSTSVTMTWYATSHRSHGPSLCAGSCPFSSLPRWLGLR